MHKLQQSIHQTMRLDLKCHSTPSRFIEHASKILVHALDGNIDAWRGFLSKNNYMDGIEVLSQVTHRALRDRIAGPQGQPSLEWLTSVASQRVPKVSPPTCDQIFFELWTSLKRKVTRLLENRAKSLPDDGYVLYFTESLGWCIVFSYRFAGNAADINIIHCIREPQAVYDIFALPLLSDEYTRSIIKNVVRSPVKLIAHRGVLVDVNRYFESRVFGPTIDTLYLHELLTRLLILDDRYTQNTCNVKTALDVGCGNGLLASGLADKCDSLTALFAIDTEIQSVTCASRNIGQVRKSDGHFKTYSICGMFDPDLLKEKVDLVVSNPPYLPYPDGRSVSVLRGQSASVRGTELLEQVIRNSSSFVSPDGALFIVYSALVENELHDSIPDNMRLIGMNNGGGFRVLFDLEVVAEDQVWLEFLRKRGLEYDSASSAYHHRLKVAAIIHSDISGVATSSIAYRVVTLEGSAS